MKKKIFTAALLSTMSITVLAQATSTGAFIDGYFYKHDFNPAYGNNRTYLSIPGVGSLNLTLMGNYGYSSIIRDNPLYPEKSDKEKTTFLNPYLTDPLSGFSKGNNKQSTIYDYSLISAGWNGWGGYNTIEINVRSNEYTSIPYELFRMAVNLGNEHYNIGNISASAQAYAELAIGHSRNINDKLRIGAKAKFIVAFADINVEMKNVTADLTGENEWRINADAQANVSLKGVRFESKESQYKAIDDSYKRVNNLQYNNPGIGGFGAAIDLGALYKVNDDLEAGLAIRDLGFIRWNNNIQASNMQKTFIFNGFHDTGVSKEAGNTPEEQADTYDDQLSQFLNLQDQGDQGGKTTMLGAKINASIQYTLPVYRKISFGALSTTRFHGKHTWTEARISTNYSIARWLSTGISAAAGTYKPTIGWMINMHPRGFNFFFGTERTFDKKGNGSIILGMNINWK